VLETTAAAIVPGRALPWRGVLLGNPMGYSRSFGKSVPSKELAALLLQEARRRHGI
jgi:hypothetical protein